MVGNSFNLLKKEINQLKFGRERSKIEKVNF